MGVQLLGSPAPTQVEWPACRAGGVGQKGCEHTSALHKKRGHFVGNAASDLRQRCSTFWGGQLPLSKKLSCTSKRRNCGAQAAQSEVLELKGNERPPGRKPRRSGSLRQYGDLGGEARGTHGEGPAERLYPLLFSELRHGAAWQALADNDQTRFRHVEQSEEDRRFSFLAMKRTIRKLRRQDHRGLVGEPGGPAKLGSFPNLVVHQVLASALETVHVPLERPAGRSRIVPLSLENPPTLFPATSPSEPAPSLNQVRPPTQPAGFRSFGGTVPAEAELEEATPRGRGESEQITAAAPFAQSKLFDPDLGWRASTSIHSAFPFLERHLAHNHWAVEGHLPSTVHAEVIIRILRQYVDDPPTVHLLRAVLHEGLTILGPPREMLTGLTHLSPFLLNLYAHEIDRFACSPPSPPPFSLTTPPSIHKILQASCLRKLAAVSLGGSSGSPGPNPSGDGVCRPWSEPMDECQLAGPVATYVRWGHTWLAAFESAEAAGEFVRRCRRFVAVRLHASPVSGSPGRQKCLADRSASFLGIRVRCKPETAQLKVKARTWLPAVEIVRHWKVSTRVPVPRVAKELQLEGFTDERMSPIGKGEWTTAPDAIIVERYHRLWSSIIAHYNGCANRREIGALFQLLRRSCAKTLARKHKNGLMWVRARYGNDLRVRAGPDGPGAAFATPRTQRALTRAWQLQLARPDPFAVSAWCVERMQAESRASLDKIGSRRWRKNKIDLAELSSPSEAGY